MSEKETFLFLWQTNAEMLTVTYKYKSTLIKGSTKSYTRSLKLHAPFYLMGCIFILKTLTI